MRGAKSRYPGVIRCAIWSIHGGKNWQLGAVDDDDSVAAVDATLEIGQGGIEEGMTRIGSRGRGWSISSRRADEELTKENVVLILSEYSVIGEDRKTKLLHPLLP